MIKAVIIEDEKPASGYLNELLQKTAPDIQVVEVIDNVADAVQWLCLCCNVVLYGIFYDHLQ